MENVLHEKYKHLQQIIKEQGSMAVAFSGGVDSTFLLKAAQLVLGDRVLAITACPYSFTKREEKEAEDFCKENGIRQEFCVINELEMPGFCENPPDRCYICKKGIFTKLWEISREKGIHMLAEGSNMDDQGDYRPGRRAIAELGVMSPLAEAGLYKEEIRILSKELGLSVWNKPSAACLASRFAYGERITKEKLDMVEQAEQLLKDLGFRQCRVRMHGELARIEVMPEELERLASKEIREAVEKRLRELGFIYITMDLQGFRSGSMNALLS